MLEELVKNLKRIQEKYGKDSKEFDNMLEQLFYFVEEGKPKPLTLDIQNSVVGVKTKF